MLKDSCGKQPTQTRRQRTVMTGPVRRRNCWSTA